MTLELGADQLRNLSVGIMAKQALTPEELFALKRYWRACGAVGDAKAAKIEPEGYSQNKRRGLGRRFYECRF